ncbi:Hypothetical protein GbCGDNIH9_0331 [Granulibacter bethesdensis]|uniref:Uncharacterized protein n=1 Tax=Granulibacter bethesdensis TaxID=364410 RepID=A0AAC9K9M6_9PROT|nr:hypothetical protein [Granulibacter bethesdensis]APH53559.1 Hypothetical protein GbCGDNIH9_0331 [Granulibacter bethesdensis]APH61137.1 Hypothetical protein GbCGDNIH8_0331 [Granulibacter bethesdensis]
MTIPFSLPDWAPSWLTFAVLVPALLYMLVFLLMPFSVFGVKSRLDNLEARLDEIQGEIRALTLRLPEPIRGQYDDMALNYLSPPVTRKEPDRPAYTRPPIPPAPQEAEYFPPSAYDAPTYGDDLPPMRGESRRRVDDMRTPRQSSRPRDGATRFSRSEPRFDRE